MTLANRDAATFTDLTHYRLDPELIRLLPEKFCRKHQVALLDRPRETASGQKEPAVLGMLDVGDDDAAQEVEQTIGGKVRRVQLNAYEIDAALTATFDGKPEEDRPHLMIVDGKERLTLSADQLIEFDRDQAVPDMVAAALSQALRRGATDIHIECYRDDVDLRFRIDGLLHQVPTPFSPANVRQVVGYLKNMAAMDMIDRMHDQDGSILTTYTDEAGQTRRIELRVAVLPGPYGEDVVLRVLDERRIQLGLSELGMTEALRARFDRLLHSPGGAILVTGPTASGKTTTLYAALRELNTDANKILTVEDPIEYELPRVNQKQITPHMSFADYARAFMRQNPDVLMIGEVRDAETAASALAATLMGHLVLTTLHTRDACSAVDRLLTLGSDRFLVVSGLLGVLSQRLVRRVCRKCGEAYTPDPAFLQRLPPLPSDMAFTRGRGCEACESTGYRGQVGVFELLEFDHDLRAQVGRGVSLNAANVPGFVTMYEDALAKAKVGVTTVEEIARMVPLPEAGDAVWQGRAHKA